MATGGSVIAIAIAIAMRGIGDVSPNEGSHSLATLRAHD
jgi:hypothetical protein